MQIGETVGLSFPIVFIFMLYASDLIFNQMQMINVNFYMKTQFIISICSIVLFSTSCRKDPEIIPADLNDQENLYSFDFSAEWSYRRSIFNDPPNPGFGNPYFNIDTVKYWFEGDTILDRHTRIDGNNISSTSSQHLYHKLKYQRIFYSDQNGQPYTTVTYGTQSFIRYDSSTMKLYITYVDGVTDGEWAELNSNEEALLIDFDLDINDTLEWSRWTSGSQGQIVVVGKEHLSINGNKFEKIELNKNGSYWSSIFTGIAGLKDFESTYGFTLIRFHSDQFDLSP